MTTIPAPAPLLPTSDRAAQAAAPTRPAIAAAIRTQVLAAMPPVEKLVPVTGAPACARPWGLQRPSRDAVTGPPRSTKPATPKPASAASSRSRHGRAGHGVAMGLGIADRGDADDRRSASRLAVLGTAPVGRRDHPTLAPPPRRLAAGDRRRPRRRRADPSAERVVDDGAEHASRASRHRERADGHAPRDGRARPRSSLALRSEPPKPPRAPSPRGSRDQASPPQPRPQPRLPISAPAPPPAAAQAQPPRTPAAATGNPTRDAQRALESGDTAKAIEYARQATASDASNTEAWLTLGAAYEASGRPALARTAYRSCAAQGRGDRVAECRALLAQ